MSFGGGFVRPNQSDTAALCKKRSSTSQQMPTSQNRAQTHMEIQMNIRRHLNVIFYLVWIILAYRYHFRKVPGNQLACNPIHPSQCLKQLPLQEL